MASKEYPYDPLTSYLFSTKDNDSLWEAFNNEKKLHLELQNAVLNAYETLDTDEQWFLDYLLFQKTSLREMGRWISMPKTTVARKRDYILRKLKRKLKYDPIVKKYLRYSSSSDE